MKNDRSEVTLRMFLSETNRTQMKSVFFQKRFEKVAAEGAQNRSFNCALDCGRLSRTRDLIILCVG